MADRKHPVSFSSTKSWNRRRKAMGLTWRRAAELGIRGQELVEELRAARLASSSEPANTVSAA